MRRSFTLARPFRRPLMSFANNSTSLHPPPVLASDVVGQEIRLSASTAKLPEGSNWISTIERALTSPSYTETSQNRGKEGFNAAEYRDPLCRGWETAIHTCHIHCSSTSILDNKPLCHRLVQMRYYSSPPTFGSGTWMRISGAYLGPLASPSVHHPFLKGGVRFKSKKKAKKAKAKRREVLSKIKRMRVASKKRKEDMTPEELLEFRMKKGTRKIELIQQALAKMPKQVIPPEDPDVEVLTAEQLHYFKKIGYKNKNYVPVGRRGIYGGTIQNIHMHWKKHETVQVEIAGFTKEEIKVMAVQLARLSGGLVVDIHQNNIVILYRGRNYKQPKALIPMKTLDKRKALIKSKLEQSMKALEENNKKLEIELDNLRKENASRNWGQFVEKKKEIFKRQAENVLQGDADGEHPEEFSFWDSPYETESDSDLEDSGSDLEDSGSDLEDTGSDLEDTGSDLEDPGSDLEDPGSDLEDVLSELSSVSSDSENEELDSDSDSDIETVDFEGDKAVGK